LAIPLEHQYPDKQRVHVAPEYPLLQTQAQPAAPVYVAYVGAFEHVWQTLLTVDVQGDVSSEPELHTVHRAQADADVC
jgi:hypothetical protein